MISIRYGEKLLRSLALGRFWGVTVAEQRRSTTHYHTFRQLICPSEPPVNPKLLYTWKRPTLRRCADLVAAADLFSLRLCRRVCRRVGSRRAEARRNRSPRCLRGTMPRAPYLPE